jgi:hypothetical protein
MLRATLLAATALLLAAPAQAASVTFRAGPLSLAAGQVARTVVTNTGQALCRVSVVTIRGTVQEDGSVALARPVGTPARELAAGAGLVGYRDPDIVPELVQAEASCDCRSLTAAQIRSTVRLSLEATTGRTDPALVAVQGTAD